MSKWAPSKAAQTFEIEIASPRKSKNRVKGVSGIRKGMAFAVSEVSEGFVVGNNSPVWFAFVRFASIEFAD